MDNFTDEFTKRIRRAGVVGAGGAGFPSYIKASSKAETVVINAAECEPLLQKDMEILGNFTAEVIGGLELLMRSTGAGEGIIGIKAKHSHLIKKIEAAINGKTGIRTVKLGDFYPAGDEFCLVYETTGRIIPPGDIPLNVGVVVNNVETVYNMFMAGKNPVTDTFLTVTGAVKNPVTLRLPVGTSFEEALRLAGGAVAGEYAAIDGGAMMGNVITDFSLPATKTTAGLIILPRTHKLIVRKAAGRETYSKTGRSVCDQCSLCTELCPRYLLGHRVQPHKVMRSLLFSPDRGHIWNEWSLLCCECSLCSLYSCPESLDPRNVCVSAKSDLRGRKISWKNSSLYSPDKAMPHPVREYRKVPVSKLLKHLGLEGYKSEAPLRKEPFLPARVRLMINQHIGTPASALVKEGQKVERGEIIADVPKDKLGVPVHASISGTVTGVNDRHVEIKA